MSNSTKRWALWLMWLVFLICVNSAGLLMNFPPGNWRWWNYIGAVLLAFLAGVSFATGPKGDGDE